MRGKIIEIRCIACCGLFKARTADLKRGWSRSCSKSCAARIKVTSRKNPQKYARMKRNFENDLVDRIILVGDL
jgi:hypothetical protein